MKRSSVTENAYVEEKMTAGVRHAKTLCMVGIVMSIVCGAVDVVFNAMQHLDVWIGGLVGALFVRWLFDGLESIIGLLCSLNMSRSKLPDAAFPQQTSNSGSSSSSNVPDLRNIKMPEQAKYDSHETAGE